MKVTSRGTSAIMNMRSIYGNVGRGIIGAYSWAHGTAAKFAADDDCLRNGCVVFFGVIGEVVVHLGFGFGH
jgi:hypothetical protein